MAKTPAFELIMPIASMKPLLAVSRREPVQAAMGLTSDGEGVLLLDRKAKPRRVMANLRAAAAKAKISLQPSTIRFGRAEIDTDYDSGMVRFFINKEPPGSLRPRLVEVVKHIPYQKVELNVDSTLEDDEEETAETEAAGPVTPVTGGAPGSGAPGTTSTIEPALTARLAGLARQVEAVASVAPGLRTTLAKLMTDAQAGLAANDAGAATDAMEALEQALRAARGDGAPLREGSAEAPNATDGAAVAFAKSSLLWRACRSRMHVRLDELKGAILTAYAAEPDVQAVVRGGLDDLDAAFAGLDERLDDALDAAGNAADPTERRRHEGEAKLLIADYIKQVASNKRLAALDDNPFGVRMDVRDTLTRTLTALVGLSKSMH